MRFQLSQFMWSIVTVCIVVFQCKLFATNTLKGLFWFWFPMAAVVMNDVSAYFCGITCGKRFIKAPFLALSPNKTWEVCVVVINHGIQCRTTICTAATTTSRYSYKK